MSETDSLLDTINEMSAYLGLLVRAAGGEVSIPYETLVEGLPNDEAVQMIVPEAEGDPLVFKVVKIDGQSDDA